MVAVVAVVDLVSVDDSVSGGRVQQLTVRPGPGGAALTTPGGGGGAATPTHTDKSMDGWMDGWMDASSFKCAKFHPAASPHITSYHIISYHI